MGTVLSIEEKYLLALLRKALQGEVLSEFSEIDEINVELVYEKARKHAVISLLYDTIQEIDAFKNLKELAEKESRRIVLRNYRLFFLTKYLTEILENKGIQVVVLKGVSTANYYPVMELRKSGDVDLLIPQNTDKEQLEKVLKDAGFVKKAEQHANHHIEFVSAEGLLVEIHTSLTEDFASSKINASMEKRSEECFQVRQSEDVMGIKLPVLNKPFHAYELLLHMLHHFLRTGFGLRLLCDWVMLWRQEWTKQEKDFFEALVEESDLKKFAEVVTAACVQYLGLEKERFAWKCMDAEIPVDDFLREILEAEEFGNADVNRMVMMNGTGLTAYIKEFHHQMHLNFPKAGKCFLLWLVLWIVTLVRFLRNNRKVRNTSARKILKEAARRSRLMEELKVFEK